MYISLYKNNPDTIFAQPVTAPSSTNYLQIVEGGKGSLWKCLRYQNNIGQGSWYMSDQDPGLVPTCQPDPPVGTCTIGNVCAGYDDIFGYVWFYCEQAAATYTYYWLLYTPGFPDLIFAGNLTDVTENLTRRVYDLDTSNYEGLSDDLLDEPLIFVLKEEDDSIIYSGYVNSWSQDGKLCQFKGIDFKKIFDTEIKLDFYADMASVNLQVSTILNKVFDVFDSNQPPLSFTIPSITTDTAYISNLLGQVFTTNALKFLKVYLATFGLFIAPMFNEVTKEIDVSITSNAETATIRLDDFLFESQKTDTKTNKCIATIKVDQETEKDYSDTQYIKSTQAYYDSLPASRKKTDTGKTGNETYFIRFNTYTFSSVWPNETAGRGYYKADVNVQTILTTWGMKFLLHIPYHPNIDFEKSWISENGGGKAFFNNTKQSNVSTPIITAHTYTDFGQGWFEIELKGSYPVDYAYFEIKLVLKNINTGSSDLGSAFLTEIANKIIFTRPQDVATVENYVYGKTTQQQDWYMSPVNPIQLTGEVPPYGFGVRTFDGTNYHYWQVGQSPRKPKPVPEKSYYLGKDNEIYEEYIAPANQIFPIQQKIIAEDFFYKAQFNAIYELVNSRFNENIIILDNAVLNPLEIEPLGFLAMVTVYDKMNHTAILPVSEIEFKKGQKRVKLGFKKKLFTEVIKS